MKTHRAVLVLSGCVLIVALALGAMAFRLARHESDYQRDQLSKDLWGEARSLADRCQQAVNQERLSMLRELRQGNSSGGILLDIEQGSPFLKNLFTADVNGKLSSLNSSNDVRKLYYPLFEVMIQRPEMPPNPSNDDTAQQRQGKAKGKVAIAQSSTTNQPVAQDDANGNLAVQILQPQQRNEQNEIVPITRFGSMIGSNPNGWIPWFRENQYCPLVWTRSEREPKVIVGAEVETVALLSRLVALFPHQTRDYFRFELTDGQGRVVYATGYQLSKNGREQRPLHHASIPISPEILPNWQVRGYLSPTALTGGGARLFTTMLQIGVLLLVIVAAGGMLFWLVRRELIVAGQRTTFVANVSHELKTPLTSIRMYSEMLLSRAGQLDEAKRKRYLEIILAESERLSRLIANVLDFSKLEAREKHYSPEDVDVKLLLVEMLDNQRPILENQGIQSQLILPEDKVVCCIDRDSLVQVLQNLFSNVIKYAADGRELSCQLEKSDRCWRIAIADRGKGIPSGQRERIFEKFYRGDQRLVAETKGTGLGLTIARGLLRDQGGDIVYRSRNGGGSEFHVVLPGIRKGH